MNKKIASAALAATLAGVMVLPAPASAASYNRSYNSQDRYISERCDTHPNWRGCDEWRSNHTRWGKSDYQRWYRWNEPNLGTVAAGIFGFAIGAAIANNANNNNGYSSGNSSWNAHVDACENRYRSYNAETDMFLGYDGNYHRCNL